MPGKNRARQSRDKRAEQQRDKRAERERRKELRRQRQRDRHESRADPDAFGAQLRPLGLRILPQAMDGNCLFRSVADTLHGDAERHREVRAQAVAFMRDNAEDFAPFMEDDEPFADYLERMGSDAEWGGNQELCACARMAMVNIVVHQFQAPRFEITIAPELPALHLAYVGDLHYDSVRLQDDPCEGPALPIDLSVSAASASGDGAAAAAAPEDDDGDVSVLLGYAPWATPEMARAAVALADGDVDAAMELLVSGAVQPEDAALEEKQREEEAAAEEARRAAEEARRAEEEAAAKKRRGAHTNPNKRNRSSPCHCGSGIKYKECCRKKDLRAARGVAEPEAEAAPAVVDQFGALEI